jgi:hypothetical protein
MQEKFVCLTKADILETDKMLELRFILLYILILLLYI